MARHDDRLLITLKYDRLVQETDRAWGLTFGEKLVWLPKSQVEDLRETENTVDLSLWLAVAKGIEDYED